MNRVSRASLALVFLFGPQFAFAGFGGTVTIGFGAASSTSVPTMPEIALYILIAMMAAVALHFARMRANGQLFSWLVAATAVGMIAAVASYSSTTTAGPAVSIDAGDSSVTIEDVGTGAQIQVTNNAGYPIKVLSRSASFGLFFATPTESPECIIGSIVQNSAVCYVRVIGD